MRHIATEVETGWIEGSHTVGNSAGAPVVANSIETATQIPKYHGRGGHGFAAEDANTISDRLRARKATVEGKSNELNGPDRVVNGVRVPQIHHLIGDAVEFRS